MKKTLWICLTLALFTAFSARATDPQDPFRVVAPILEEEKPVPKDTSCGSPSRPFSVVVWPTIAPFGWVERIKRPNEQEIIKPFGLFYNLFKDVAEHNNKVVYFVPTATLEKAEELTALKAADILLGYYYDNTPYAKFQPLYPAVIQNPVVIITLKGKMPQERALENLIYKRGVMREDEKLYTLVHPMLPKKMKIDLVRSAKDAFQQLLSGDADFIITGRYSAEAELRRFKIKSLVDISEPIKNPSIFFAVAKDNPCRQEIQDFFKQYMEPIINDYDAMGDLLRGQLDIWQDQFLYDPALKATSDEADTNIN